MPETPLAKELTGQGATVQYISAGRRKPSTVAETPPTPPSTLTEASDVVINNVGIQPPSSYVDAVDLPEEAWERIININLRSRFLMAKYSVPSMRQRGGGVII